MLNDTINNIKLSYQYIENNIYFVNDLLVAHSITLYGYK